MEARMGPSDLSICATQAPRERGALAEDLLEDPRDDIAALEEAEWTEHTGAKALEGLSILDRRSADIIRRRWLKPGTPETLEWLAEEYQVSPERIRQIQNCALAKLRDYVESPPEAFACA
jgi:RNA polymerase sigma-32 factor